MNKLLKTVLFLLPTILTVVYFKTRAPDKCAESQALPAVASASTEDQSAPAKATSPHSPSKFNSSQNHAPAVIPLTTTPPTGSKDSAVPVDGHALEDSTSGAPSLYGSMTIEDVQEKFDADIRELPSIKKVGGIDSIECKETECTLRMKYSEEDAPHINHDLMSLIEGQQKYGKWIQFDRDMNDNSIRVITFTDKSPEFATGKR